MSTQTASNADPGSPAQAPRVIRIRGARVHNLQNVDLDIPRDQLVVLTGPSGSGKSSLAFDTLYAEGQRQYIESLSVYARQFLHQLERPDVDLIDGLQPTICIDQRPGSVNPRSTVATVTEVYDYLRLMMARLGQASCHECGQPISQQSPEQIVDSLMQLPDGTKMMMLAPVVLGRRGRHEEVFELIRKAGYVRVRVDGQVYDLENRPLLEPRRVHNIEVVVDRIVLRTSSRGRVAESLRNVLRLGEGLMIATYRIPSEAGNGSDWEDRIFSTQYACPNCNVSYAEIEPRTFSFNSPYGACPVCQGLGYREEFDPELVLPEPQRSLEEGAIAPWRNGSPSGRRKQSKAIEPLIKALRIDPDKSLDKWTPVTMRKFLRGDGKKLPGLLTLLEKEYVTATREARRQHLETFRGAVTCHACEGSRLGPAGNHVRLAELTISEITRMPVSNCLQYFQQLEFGETQRPIADPLLSEILNRLKFLDLVGVGYLSLDRPADTLSGGELQRVRLATSIGSGLIGVCYILDEPSIGLHPRDNQRLIDALRDLQQQGNTVVVVEHDEAMMRSADRVIDMGPGAGHLGGRIVAEGTLAEVAAQADSPTGKYLSGQVQIPVPKKRRPITRAQSIVLEQVQTNNLQDVTVRFPLGVLLCVTGVSGSGKSSLVNETLAHALTRKLGGVSPRPGPFKRLRGASQIDKVIQVDQSPIGRTPRSIPATYTGVFDDIRKVFASTRDAKQRGYRVSRFSFNVKGGRCEQCQGQGLQRIEMNFLPDLFVTCSQCQGARFNRSTLQVKYRDRSIADVLEMCVDEALEFFGNFSQIERTLQSLSDVGLGYLPLGQASTTLSGGEAQRVKLATELARADTGSTLYLLDEPTTGLHFEDVQRLLNVLNQLVDRGNTVLVIEHNLDVIKSADWLLDLGPEGGDGGGQLVAEGAPEQVAQVESSHTGNSLRRLVGPRPEQRG